MAQPPHEPSDENRHAVEALVAAGTSMKTISKALQISMGALRRHYRTELDQGRDLATARVVRRLFQLIDAGSTPAVVFYLKCRAGWKEGQVIEVEDKTPKKNFDFSALSRDEKEALRKSLAMVVRGHA